MKVKNLDNIKENELNGNSHESHEELGESHLATAKGTPLRADAFDLSNDEKMTIIEGHFSKIMETMGLDLTDDSLSGTPYRVAKMFVREIFSGLDPANKPVVKTFNNQFEYGQMLIEKDISVFSTCEHHFLPIVGKAHVAYIPSGKVVGLSKLNRIVDYYARRPQVQERLTMQIANELQESLDTEDVAVVIEAKHFCVISRGIEDTSSTTLTTEYRGQFKQEAIRKEFQEYLNMKIEI